MIKYCICALIFLSSCAPSRLVKPLNKNQYALGVSAGGPMINFANLVIPMPFTSVYGAYGVHEKVSVAAGLHTTAALFGVMQTDVTAVINVFEADSGKFGISLTPGFNYAIDKWEKENSFYPTMEANVYKMFSQRKMIYAGLSSWFNGKDYKAHGEVNTKHIILNPHVGLQTGLHKKFGSQFEIKYLGAGLSNEDIVVDYAVPFKKGAIGIYYSLIMRF